MADSKNPNEPPDAELDRSAESDSGSGVALAELGASFRQSRREMLVMLGAWTTFFIWTGVCGALFSRFDPGEAVPVIFGMPRWAFFGLVLPWICANIFIFWFASRFMKDTNLGPEDGEHDTSDHLELG